MSRGCWNTNQQFCVTSVVCVSHLFFLFFFASAFRFCGTKSFALLVPPSKGDFFSVLFTTTGNTVLYTFSSALSLSKGRKSIVWLY